MHTDEVLVRWMDVDDVAPTTVACWRGWLHPDEIARADRFRFDADRLAYIGAHALARSLLASVGPYPVERVALRQRPQRKARDRPGAGVATALQPVPQPRRSSPQLSPIGTTSASTSRGATEHHASTTWRTATSRLTRWRSSGRTPPTAGRDAFFRLWTLKEAFIKATGEGLRRSLQSFAFTLDPIAVTFPTGPSTGAAPGEWQFFQARPTARHVVAAAVRRLDGPEVSFVPAGVAPDDLAGCHTSYTS